MPTERFQSSDLAKRYAEVLATVQSSGEALVVNSDGTTVAIIANEGWRDLQELAGEVTAFLALEQAISAKPMADLTVTDLGAWCWVQQLPADDVPVCIDELRSALLTSLREGQPGVFRDELRAWRETAAALDDPERREALLTKSFDPSDYIEVGRPE